MTIRIALPVLALFGSFAPLTASALPQRPAVAARRAIADPHPSALAVARSGRGLATKLARPSTKLGRFVSVLGKAAGAAISAPQPTTPEGTYGEIPGDKAYDGPVRYDHVDQGHLADCFFVASLASVAFTHPEILQKAITERSDGTMSVRLYHRTPSGAFEADDVTINKLVPLTNGRPTFARSSDATQMWPAWMQKAYTAEASYATRVPASYATINNGGQPADAFEALTGKPAQTLSVNPSSGASLFSSIATALKGKHPVAAVTPKTLPAGAPVHEWHTYSVLAAKVVGGKRMLTVRNPWGYSEPGNENGGDGIFDITIEQFTSSFTSMAIGG